ncbi:PREDICTED: U11/U12 small nuclear ribonucleoprotein 48 kDa protein-like isoform X2 [Branchiostoma belcheri]|uniref:U11/U12 small nuclear ribonucleoprotein 48 kDa protein-like isoform X1 n=1 Tax=Branchiostoma belcheri TaxID=7741 RepID=A0A6P4XNA0_BRABE|nr:PREDICTED: U11/U12 small nuclear ribonucleoprotein 48 kDa protein-like isoform X1 [Branchiostoma belcheri]XP_019618140.1 PREDICTED: U11/U12 small nuclear ribonucleoprotein 48 kDa protein-like isoform X2 [Branchiostoma belcheri]
MHETREDQLAELSCYLDGSSTRLSGVLQRLGWTDEKTSDVDLALCPLNSAHRVPPSSLADHVRDCRLAKAGYDAEERERMKESSEFYYAKSTSVVPVVVDREMQEKVISQCPPSSSSRDQGRDRQTTSFTQAVSSASSEERSLPLRDEELTTAQKLAMHNYVVQQASKANNRTSAFSAEDSSLTADLAETVQKQDDDSKGPKSHLEILAELRDYKRRRQSYRAKNVHITKRSTTEVMRQVIETQMEMLEQMNRGSNDSERNSSGTDNRSSDRTSSPAVRVDSPRRHGRPDSPRPYQRHRREERHSKHKKSRDKSRSRSPSRRKKHRH